MTHREETEEIVRLEIRSAPQCWNVNDIESRMYVDNAARLLNEQWPRGGSISDYTCKLVGLDHSSAEIVDGTNYSAPKVDSLPCSYLLINTRNCQLVGHGRLTECLEGPGGNAAAATYIVTHPLSRGKGYGTALMRLLEQEAIKLGYHYIYLWTTTAIPFYCKLNYTRTERISLNSACLKSLQAQQVGALEAMLAKRSQEVSGTAARKKRETVTLTPDDVTENDVWLRKRLVEYVASIAIPLENRMKELHAAIHQYPPNKNRWEFCLHNVPWQQQIGPSCGLAALRMLREFYQNLSSTADGKVGCLPSLLIEAQTKGYSADGEVFDVDNMIKLAGFCGLNTLLQSFHTMSFVDVFNILKDGGTLIVPYDSQPFTKNPCLARGNNAHYGIVVGMMLGFDLNRPMPLDDSPTGSTTMSLTGPQLVEITNVGNRTVDPTRTLLLVQHGLSCKLTIAPLENFMVSNGQLNTIDVTKCCHLPENTKMNLSDSVIVCYHPDNNC